jgi:hypothetical protein
MPTNDLTVLIVFGDLRVQVIHEGQSGNGPLTQATIMQLSAEWPNVTADAIEKGLIGEEDEALEEADNPSPDD